MADSNINDLLIKADKGMCETKDQIAVFLRSIFLDLSVTTAIWDKKINEYVSNPRHGINTNPVKRSSEKSNINRALSSDKVAWNQLIRALQILDPEEIEIVVRPTWDANLQLPKAPPEEVSYTVVGRSNALHIIFERMLRMIEITPSLWTGLIERYINDPENKVSSNPAKRSTDRGNLDKLLRKNTLSWNGFKKALRFLGAKEATVTIILRFSKDAVYTKRRVTQHTLTFKTN